LIISRDFEPKKIDEEKVSKSPRNIGVMKTKQTIRRGEKCREKLTWLLLLLGG